MTGIELDRLLGAQIADLEREIVGLGGFHPQQTTQNLAKLRELDRQRRDLIDRKLANYPNCRTTPEQAVGIKIGFLRFHGRAAAYVYVGPILHAVRRAYGDPELDEQGLLSLLARGELSYRELDYNEATPDAVLVCWTWAICCEGRSTENRTVSDKLVKTSERLQEIANRKDHNRIVDEADDYFALDVNDCDNVAGTYSEGLESGLLLAQMLAKASPGAAVWCVTYPDYVDDDGLAWFVGTEAEVAARLEALEADGDEGEEE